MTDNTELKRPAEAAPEGPWYQHGGIKQVLSHDCETVCETFEEDGDCPTARFIAAANPAVVLALIAENERLNSLFDQSEKCIDRINALHQEAWVKKLGVSYPNYGGFPDNLEQLSIERDQLKAENEALRKRIDDMSPFKGAPLTGPDTKCLACGGYHYGMGGLPCPNMRVTAQANLPETRSGQIGAVMGKGEQS